MAEVKYLKATEILKNVFFFSVNVQRGFENDLVRDLVIVVIITGASG